MSFRQHVEAHTTAAFSALIARASEQALQELDAVRVAHQRHSEALAARLRSPLDPANGERLLTLVNDLSLVAKDEAQAAARAARAEALDELQTQMQSAQAQARSEIEAARAAHQSDLEAAAATKAALTEALAEARNEADRARAAAQAEIEIVWAEAERACAHGRADVETARAEAEAARAEALTFGGRLAQVEAALADLRAQLQAEKSAAASLSSALVEVRNEADRATAKANAARRDTRTRMPEAITPVEPFLPREACLAIDTANSLREVLNALLDQLAMHFSRAALFVIKGDRVQSWRGVGFQGSSADLRTFEVPLTATSLLTKAVRTGRLVVTGDCLDQNGSSLGEGVDTAVALPIRIADSVVAVAYADGGQPSAHEPPRIIRTSTLRDAEMLVEHAVGRLTTLLATSGVIPGFKAAPSAAPDDSLRVVSFPQSGRSDDETNRGNEALVEVKPEVPRARSVKARRPPEPVARGISSPRRAALVALHFVGVVAIASQAAVYDVGAGRRHAPSSGSHQESAPVRRVAEDAQEAAAARGQTSSGVAVKRLSGPAALPARAAADELILTLLAQGVCWISVTMDGSQPVERLLQPNETIVLRAREEVFLKVGDAAALSVLINDQQVKTLGTNGQVVTRLITRANYSRYLAGRS